MTRIDTTGLRVPHHLSRLRQSVRAIPPGLWMTAVAGWLALLCTKVITPDSTIAVLRPVAVFAFVLIGPGWAVAKCIPLQTTLERWVVAVAFGMSSVLLVSVGFTFARNDSMELRLVILAAIATTASVAAMYRAIRSTTSDEAVLR
ncbi:hypothetical protein [Rhodococcus chondri]|uniref:DUF1616 domain-containing protein n=1 Tax=Rhodococcus chondri TaxID=3065941 RepID=A0ABU7JPH2_9NOCA|nr:hypothetical protein [Rhodococcus sp. CC-R104]MEE2031642.1 hypothetical protein [Rhodococcus sp. CC-R104]